MRLGERLVCAALAGAATLLLFAVFWLTTAWRAGMAGTPAASVVTLRLLPLPLAPLLPLSPPDAERRWVRTQQVEVLRSATLADTITKAVAGAPREIVDTGPPASLEAAASAPAPANEAPALNLIASRATLLAAAGAGAQTKTSIRANSPEYISATEQAVRAAERPECLSREALRHQPPTLLGIGVSGILVIPSWIKAGVTGKCGLPGS